MPRCKCPILAVDQQVLCSLSLSLKSKVEPPATPSWGNSYGNLARSLVGAREKRGKSCEEMNRNCEVKSNCWGLWHAAWWVVGCVSSSFGLVAESETVHQSGSGGRECCRRFCSLSHELCVCVCVCRGEERNAQVITHLSHVFGVWLATVPVMHKTGQSGIAQSVVAGLVVWCESPSHQKPTPHQSSSLRFYTCQIAACEESY